ncbi:MAG: hypothetical protein KGL39_10735 [Patescibacteria group bacterium]|nr:hypothetical protein [Patescibacteria group bacterium]
MPLPGFIADADLQVALEDMLKVPRDSLGSGDSAYVQDILHDANVSAYQEIQGRLLRRGITQAQLDSWDRGAEFQKSIGLYWTLINAAGLSQAIEPAVIKALDRRSELSVVELYSGGVPLVPPTPPAEGLVTTGVMDTSTDMFVSNPYDLRRGLVTRW